MFSLDLPLSCALISLCFFYRAGISHEQPISGEKWEALKEYASNRRWLLMYLTGRFAPMRTVALAVARRRRGGVRALEPGAHESSLFAGVDVPTAVAELRRDGCSLGLRLPQELVREIREFAVTHPAHLEGREEVTFLPEERLEVSRRIGAPILLGRFQNPGAVCGAIQRIQNDPVLLAIASAYLGTKPMHRSHRLWWSYATAPEEGEISSRDRVRSAQGFHWDLDDYLSVTFFFYLSDVDEEGGPHVVVRGSHRNKRLRWLWSPFKARKEEEVLAYYGQEPLLAITGKAGFGFAEDLFCIHKGAPPHRSDRLMLQVRFGLNEYGRFASDAKAAR